MAKRKYAMTEKKVQRYRKEGRGQGSMGTYKPWINIHDFPSLGRVHRISGMTTQRITHLMSDGEGRFFTQCDWLDDVTDIREQFPLNREITYRIAREAGIRHPTTRDGTPYVLTTDFLLIMGDGEDRRVIARTFKQSSDLLNKRVLEKLEIERRYWIEMGVEWGIVTEESLDLVLINNVEAVRAYADLTGLRSSYHGCYKDAGQIIVGLVRDKYETRMRDACHEIDNRLNVVPGTALIAAKHLIAHKHLITDMYDATLFEERLLSLFSINSERLT